MREVLLGKVLGVTRSALIVRGPEPIAADALHQYRGLIERRATGTPVAYLTGRREFWSLQLEVTPAVLVPRPETETLVELALRLLPLDREPSVLDLGTGSGAIALAIAAERPRARVTGIDISPAALGVARRNASRPRAAAGRVAARFMVRAGGGRALRPHRRQSAVCCRCGSGTREARRRAPACAALRADRTGIARGDHRAGGRASRIAGMGCCSSTAAAKDRRSRGCSSAADSPPYDRTMTTQAGPALRREPFTCNTRKLS